MPSLMGRTGFQYRSDVASRVMAGEAQGTHVQVIVPLSGPGQGQIGVRVGRLLVSVANREDLGSFVPAWGQAGAFVERAFGPNLPLPRLGESLTADWWGGALASSRSLPPLQLGHFCALTLRECLVRHSFGGSESWRQ